MKLPFLLVSRKCFSKLSLLLYLKFLLVTVCSGALRGDMLASGNQAVTGDNETQPLWPSTEIFFRDEGNTAQC